MALALEAAQIAVSTWAANAAIAGASAIARPNQAGPRPSSRAGAFRPRSRYVPLFPVTTLLTIAALLGCFSSGQFTWMSTWLPELYPTRMRATGAGFIFNASRIPAAFGVLIAGAIIAQLGGYGNAAMTIATVYLLGLAAAPFLPETHGKPLPR